jgi:hypothetical protein
LHHHQQQRQQQQQRRLGLTASRQSESGDLAGHPIMGRWAAAGPGGKPKQSQSVIQFSRMGLVVWVQLPSIILIVIIVVVL